MSINNISHHLLLDFSSHSSFSTLRRQHAVTPDKARAGRFLLIPTIEQRQRIIPNDRDQGRASSWGRKASGGIMDLASVCCGRVRQAGYVMKTAGTCVLLGSLANVSAFIHGVGSQRMAPRIVRETTSNIALWLALKPREDMRFTRRWTSLHTSTGKPSRGRGIRQRSIKVGHPYLS